MSRANPFGDLDDFAAGSAPKPVPAAAIDRIAESAGFPSRKARDDVTGGATGEAGEGITDTAPPARAPRRRTTGRNRQINIKATDAVIDRLYAIADTLDLPLGAVLERALDALAEKAKAGAEKEKAG